MTAVFLGFVSDPDVVVKTIGLGLASAILIDVLVVRMVIAPAVMTLLGDRAWALPAWLDRALPRISLEGEPEPALVLGQAGTGSADSGALLARRVREQVRRARTRPRSAARRPAWWLRRARVVAGVDQVEQQRPDPAMPSDIPSCCIACRTLDAEPTSWSSTPPSTMSNSGTNTMPMPMPATNSGATKSSVPRLESCSAT